MSGQQQPNAWSTGRPRHTQHASRTPQNRSGTASPAPSQSDQAPRQDSGRSQQTNNVWAKRSSSTAGSNGQKVEPPARVDEAHTPANGFNAAEVKAALGSESAPTSYKLPEAAAGRAGGAAWGSKPGHMANNQPFFVQLAKQVATMEGGG